MPTRYEHDIREMGNGPSWALVIGIALFLLVIGLVTRAVVPSAHRSWDYGAFPDVPGQSPYSIDRLPSGIPRQMAPLPEARPPGGRKDGR